MQMTRNGVVMNFTYINGIPATLSYGGNTFYYVVNGQGDITAITDSQGIIQVTYYYDAWGSTTSIYNPDSTHGLTLATINPLRYRSYVYDWEVGLYYLQSRYYIPEIGRFLSPDNYPSTGQGVIGNNMLAYCGNNPVSRQDEGGEWWNVVIGAVVGGVVNAVSTWASGGSAKEIVVSAACGAVSGAVAATGVGGLAGQMLVGAATSAIDSGYQNYNDYKSGDKTLVQAIGGTVVDAAMGGTSGAMGFEGKSALKTSNQIAKSAQIASKTLKTKGLNPKVKARAIAAVRKGRKYALNEIKNTAIDSIGSEIMEIGVSRITELYFGGWYR